MRHEVATIRHLVKAAAEHFQLCAQRVEGFTSAVVAGIINLLVLVCLGGFGVASAGPTFIWGRHHSDSPSTRRSSATGQARRPQTRIGRSGPSSRQAHPRKVCGWRFRWNAAVAVSTAARLSRSRDTRCDTVATREAISVTVCLSWTKKTASRAVRTKKNRLRAGCGGETKKPARVRPS